MMNIESYPDFAAAANAVLKFLHDRFGFNLWMITRVANEDWIVLHVEDHGYGVANGDILRWADSFCSEMVKGHGPQIATRCQQIPAYQQAPINQKLKIGAYIGLPLMCNGGNLFGTLCAIHPEPVKDTLADELPLLQILSRLLVSILETELNAQQQRRRAERAEMEALADPLTGLYNRRGWNRLLDAEENRCARYGYSACVLVIDVDDLKQINDTKGHSAGDHMLLRTAKALRSILRQDDVAARVGGDEFTVLGIETDGDAAQALAERIRLALAAVQVNASVGLAMRVPSQGLISAWNQADTAMYMQKHAKKQARALMSVPISAE